MFTSFLRHWVCAHWIIDTPCGCLQMSNAEHEQRVECAAKRVKVDHSDAAEWLAPPDQCVSPLMDVSEAAAVTINFKDAPLRLCGLLREKGVAIVTDVLGAEDMSSLEEALGEDLRELIDQSLLAEAGESVRDAWTRVRKEGLQSWPAASLADVGARCLDTGAQGG